MKKTKQIATFCYRLFVNLLLFLLPISFCFSQDVNLSSQFAVDNFDPTITSIGGNLTIFGSSIQNLDNLTNLTNVGGDLRIFNTSLQNIDGLANITNIIGDITIDKNNDLLNIDGLTSLTNINVDLTIEENDDLLNIDGLANITNINGNLSLFDNITLQNIDGLANLANISGYISISSNNALTNLDGLLNLTNMNESLSVQNNAMLNNIDGLSNLTSIGGSLSLSLNNSLQNIDGLSNLTTIGKNLSIGNHSSLENIDGLSNLTSIGESLSINSNDSLQNIDGLRNLTFLGGSLNIINNSSIQNIDGLSNLTTINGSVLIGFLTFGNISLQNLNGLGNLTAINGSLTIVYNDVLTDCCAIQNLLSTPGAIAGIVDIHNNPSACSSENEIITSACSLSISVNTTAPCLNTANGLIEVSTDSVSSPPFTYTLLRIEDGLSLNGVGNDSIFIIDSLEEGTYDLTVISNGGDTAIQNGIVLFPIPLEINISSSHVTCNGNNDGTAIANVNGGFSPYTYNWSQNDMDSLAENLAAGLYFLTVTDSIACTIVDSVFINEPAILSASVNVYSTLCFGNNNGSITFETTTGGTPPYLYTIDGLTFSSQTAYFELPPDEYFTIVEDANGCVYQDTFIIMEADDLNISITAINDISCNSDNDGAVAAIISGGTAPYTYQWNNGGSDSIAVNLVAGYYSLTITDDNDCSAIDSISISEPELLSVNLTSNNNSCFGDNDGSIEFGTTTGGTLPYSYSIDGSNFSNQTLYSLPPGTYTAYVKDDNDCIFQETIVIDQAQELSLNLVSIDISCFGANDGAAQAIISGGNPPYSYEWSNGEMDSIIENIIAADYSLTVTDANACTAVDNIAISDPASLAVSITANNSLCFGDNNGSIHFDEVQGGVLPFLYTIEGDNFSAQTQYNQLSLGTYLVAVQDANSCIYEETISIDEAAELVLNLGLDTIIDLGDSLLVQPEHNLIVVDTFIWAGAVCINCPEVTVAPTSALNISLTIAGLNGCLASDDLLLRVDTNTDLFVPNAFSPNNDGLNDWLFPQTAPNGLNINEFVILNRWGGVVFERHDFEPNDSALGWDGTFKGQLLPSGVFVWYAKTTLLNGEEKLFKGDVVLVR